MPGNGFCQGVKFLPIHVVGILFCLFQYGLEADVSQMAKNLVGGGGHMNANNGLFAGFKDSFSYENVKAQITDLITKKTILQG